MRSTKQRYLLTITVLLVVMVAGVSASQTTPAVSATISPTASQRPYEVALERIAEAKRTGTTLLSLRDLDLTELPPEIGQLSALEILDLFGAPLTSLPPEIGDLTNLRELILGWTALSSLPPEIGQLAHLERLVITQTQLATLPPEIGQLRNLQELDLSSNSLLKTFPPVIGQLENLQRLYLSGLGLTSLPDELGQLRNLQSLRLDNGGLATRALPPIIGKLTNLEELNLSSTGITSLPADIGQLRNLQRFNLISNQLTSLPAEIGQLHLLQTLELDANPLVILPPEIGMLHDLRKLTLSQTELTSLPPEIGQLKALEELNIVQTKLLTLPNEFGQLHNLKNLSACCSSLVSLPSTFGQLDNLEIAYLYSNKLVYLPSQLGQLKKLNTLYLSGNALVSIPAEIGQLSGLEALYLDGNKLTYLPPEIGQLGKLCFLNLSYNQLTRLPNELGLLWELNKTGDCGTYSPIGLRFENNPLIYPPATVLEQGTAFILSYLRTQSLTATPRPLATSTSLPSATPSASPTLALTFVPSATPTLIPTIGASPTMTPTATNIPVLATAVAEGECVKSFTTFAYGRPVRDFEKYPPLPPWKLETDLPTQQFGEYDDGYAFVVLSRTVDGQREIWIGQYFYFDKAPTIAIYRPTLQSWEFIPAMIEGTTLFVGSDFFLDRDGTIWGQTEWNPRQETAGQSSVPVLSKFNESTRRFELAESVLEIPMVMGDNYYNATRILLDQQGAFWIFAENDGIYQYEPATQRTQKQFSIPNLRVTYSALALDGSIYFQTYGSGGWLFQLADTPIFHYIPATNTLSSVELPSDPWPVTYGMVVDHLGRLWLGASGYRDVDDSWHLINPHPNEFFDVVDDGSFFEWWFPPVLISETSDGRLWYYKFQDSSGAVDGMAWYDPTLGEGCLFTNQFSAAIVEDSQQQLWIASRGKLYTRPLKS